MEHSFHLLLCHKGIQSQFFDLERDPFELHNRFDDPAYQAEIAELRDALGQWALFDAPSQVYRDECALVIGGDNVPVRGDGHRAYGRDYFRRRMNDPFSWSV